MIIRSLLPALAVAVAAGLIGCFAVVRRMTLAADALSHVALPGIGMALAFGINPMIGALATLAFGALMVWALEDRTRATTESVIGVVFSAALAIGSLITTGDGLIDALFGQRVPPSATEAGCAIVAAVFVAIFVVAAKHRLIVALISPDIARTSGINVRRLNLVFLQVFALTMALGLRYLGVLLMGSLVIIPAVTAKRLATHFDQMLVLAAGLAVAATLVGTLIAVSLHRSDTGPVIVLTAAAGFFLSLVWRR